MRAACWPICTLTSLPYGERVKDTVARIPTAHAPVRPSAAGAPALAHSLFKNVGNRSPVESVGET